MQNKSEIKVVDGAVKAIANAKNCTRQTVWSALKGIGTDTLLKREIRKLAMTEKYKA